jgi:peptidoglycan/xylan/chitin deacetylase (PgdA/CDA1 family)
VILRQDPLTGLSGTRTPGFGALVISLDFELHWGVRDKESPSGRYRDNLLGAREVIPRILDLFAEFGVAATWATVGFLFARTRREMENFRPAMRPWYENSLLSPYQEALGDGEEDDPLHFAPSLIETIRRTPRQEVSTHTFSHYYCLAPGQDREAFRADLDSAAAIARKYGMPLRSIVFPRNQHNPAYDDLLLEVGIICYRGNQPRWMYQAVVESNTLSRGARLLDTYFNVAGSHLTPWHQVPQDTGLCNVPASFFLRPYSPRLRRLDRLRLRRLAKSMKEAATSGQIIHLWWHPHNFGSHMDQNMSFLRSVLDIFANYGGRYGFRSLSMVEVAEHARRATALEVFDGRSSTGD